MRGTVEAAGYILDVPVIGEPAARARVLAAWAAGASLRALPDGRWLVLLAAPVTVRAERAPGLPVLREGTTLRAGSDEPGSGLVELRHGRTQHHDVDALPRLDPSAWLELPPVVALRPLDAPPVPVTVVRPEPPEELDLRGVATLASAGEQTERLFEAAKAGTRRRGWFARLVLRSPAAGVVGRRHKEYLDKLTRAFETGDYENALRDAIALGGAGAEWLSLRLPGRREGELRPSDHLGGGGGAVPWPDSIGDLLRQLYLKAAKELEYADQIERAAFVHSDLLHAPYDAVALLERHRRFALAARLAEARDLVPALAVSLWWRAGRRERAIALARERGAWYSALQRVENANLARDLREAWVEAERERGDHRAAIDAAWPDPLLREQIGPDLAALRELGGAPGATALALALAWRPDTPTTEEALALLAPRPSGAAVRLALLEGLADHPAADPLADRRLASAALRAVLREGATGELRTTHSGRALFEALRERADPLLRADLPVFRAGRQPGGNVHFEAPADRGALELRDAVLLPAGVLVAHGALGVRLLRPDGRELARWADTPADQLIPADHGTSALVVAHGESVAQVRHLDLTTRRLSHVAALAGYRFLDTFDGAIVIAAHEGIEGVDLTHAPPRTAWSELDQRTEVRHLARTATSLSAIVDTPLEGRPGERSIERWTWRMPARALEQRDLQSDEWAPDAQTTAGGRVVWIEGDHLRTDPGPRDGRPLDGPSAVAVSGDRYALITGGRVEVARATLEFPEADGVRLRVFGDVATAFSTDGRVLAVDLTNDELLARLRLAPR
ncbi:hypothetical protein DVA67_006165 [Solirubrobacter sp. CPCC 204708]|nr:hypothetical protein [Solirubrobacter deserti]